MSADDAICITDAHQNNLKHLDLVLPLGELIVVTGVSGSGKSSLAFDTVYAEGQRRYVETFSPYARQFLDRMDKPAVGRIDGIPPAIAINQVNPVRTSRSTVGTMTELADHLKLLFARAARLYCQGCGRPVVRDSPRTILADLLQHFAGARAHICFRVPVPENFVAEEITQYLAAQGYTRIQAQDADGMLVIQDRLRLSEDNRDRAIEALAMALRRGDDALSVVVNPGEAEQLRSYSGRLHCPDCDRDYRQPIPNSFSFNSPVGACPACRGFGRTMGIDFGLAVPDAGLSLKGGAVKVWQSKSYQQCQRDLLRFAKQRGVAVDVPWRELDAATREWVIEGEGRARDGHWYGLRRFFDWLETKAYKMHVRVLLSKYRSYEECTACGGARLQADALNWRLGDAADRDAALAGQAPFRHPDNHLPDAVLAGLPGLAVHDVMRLSLARCAAFFEGLSLPGPLDQATELLLGEIRTRLAYLTEVGLAYLTLDRQSRTLSGGEVQRINLTTALGTSLVNTLFVLDEPSIGLHACDMDRVTAVLHRLRDAGNTLLVVEHDEQVMLAADRILDMGPGPGSGGGEIVFNGSPAQLVKRRGSLTADYLRQARQVLPADWQRRPVDADAPALLIRGAAQNNLRNVDLRLPLGRLVCVTGVSGSGKSTLVEDVLYRGLAKQFGRAVDAPGMHAAIEGAGHLEDVVFVDQSAIGKTTRSNPASYVGAFNIVRELFAAAPAAIERGYTAGTFSFNTGNGRCPTCAGNGFEHIEMQFLSDVYLRCADCDGRRFRAEILEVQIAASDGGTTASVADVLEMTVADALAFFAGHEALAAALGPLAAVGLEYLQLGQPVPTLSGGEAQRLKLAGHLAEARKRARQSRHRRRYGAAGGTLFLFDEPTTGLHFEDIHKLLRAFGELLAEGNSLVVIEHHLEVIDAADHVIDMGPEGGEGGGQLLYAGSPAGLRECTASHTGAALRARDHARRGKPALAARRRGRARRRAGDRLIRIHNAREHNLRNVDVDIPRGELTVITGISGSGKSTVAFDILFAEGQRRYLESLNAYARQFVQPAARPDVDAIFGIPPSVAIEQRTSRGGRKSTVATQTELYHFLRLLYVKLGTQFCPDCELPIEPQTVEAITARLMKDHRGRELAVFAPLVVARKGYYTDLARWAAGKGFARLRVDGELLPTADWPRLDRFREHDIDLPVGQLKLTPTAEPQLRALLQRALGHGAGTVRVAPARGAESLFSTERACPGCGTSFEALDPRLFSFNSKRGWCPDCYGTGLQLQGFDEAQTGEEGWWLDEADAARQCRRCHGERLNPTALAVRFREQPIHALTRLSVDEARRWFTRLKLSARETGIARDIVAEIDTRLSFLHEVGLGYLSLDRAAPTLSGGEAQRIRLAAQLGSNLRGVCYILDEPTIGLHTRDNRMLLDTLRGLQQRGNTVVVVEHDEDTIRSADNLVDLGPGAGVEGGRVVASGSLAKLMRAPESVTGRHLRQPLKHPLPAVEALRAARAPAPGELELTGVRANNINGLDARIPLGALVCVTGVSGSGKSTLVRDVLHENLARSIAARKDRKRARKPKPYALDSIAGAQHVDRVLEVDQTPIGKTPRSCPATYVGFWDAIRKSFAATAEARMRGFGPARFSFNVKEGRCDACDGQGVQRIEMNFLPDVRVGCDVCGGARFNRETLQVTWKGATIADVLNMSVVEALAFFDAQVGITHPLALLRDIGLGYLTLGQPSPTLSGGEAQRIKLVTELARARPVAERLRRTPPHTLYLLDEPSIGLHMADVEKLVLVLHRLVNAGNSVILIEHNLDLVAAADHVIDLGPEGGSGGGRICAAGSPAEVARVTRRSHTGRALAEFLARHGR